MLWLRSGTYTSVNWLSCSTDNQFHRQVYNYVHVYAWTPCHS